MYVTVSDQDLISLLTMGNAWNDQTYATSFVFVNPMVAQSVTGAGIKIKGYQKKMPQK